MQGKRDRKRNKRAGAKCRNQHGLGEGIHDDEQNEDDSAGQRALQEVPAKIFLSDVAVEIQGSAPNAFEAECTRLFRVPEKGVGHLS